MWNLKNGTNELIYKTEIESQIQKTNMVPREEKEEGAILGDQDWKIHSTIYKIDN